MFSGGIIKMGILGQVKFNSKEAKASLSVTTKKKRKKWLSPKKKSASKWRKPASKKFNSKSYWEDTERIFR